MEDFFKKYNRCDRGKILDLFAKLEFIISEIIILKVMGYDPEKAQLMENILDNVSLFARVKLLKDWNIIDKKLYEAITPVREVRNGLAHYWDESDVIYKQKNLKAHFSKFVEDMHSIFKKLISIYMQEQEKIDIDSIMAEIQKIKMIETKDN